MVGNFPDHIGRGIGTVLAVIGLCAPLFVRRRYPLGSTLMMLAVATVHLAFDLAPIPADAALLVGVYTMASRSRWVRSDRARGRDVAALRVHSEALDRRGRP